MLRLARRRRPADTCRRSSQWLQPDRSTHAHTQTPLRSDTDAGRTSATGARRSATRPTVAIIHYTCTSALYSLLSLALPHYHHFCCSSPDDYDRDFLARALKMSPEKRAQHETGRRRRIIPDHSVRIARQNTPTARSTHRSECFPAVFGDTAAPKMNTRTASRPVEVIDALVEQSGAPIPNIRAILELIRYQLNGCSAGRIEGILRRRAPWQGSAEYGFESHLADTNIDYRLYLIP